MSKSVNISISRRAFITRSAAGTAFLAAGSVSGLFARDIPIPESWPANAPAFRFHMIGHAHIDPVWLWNWSEGLAIVHSTFRSALDRMDENPEFCFTASSALFYQWVAENDPKMLEEIKKRVAEGRWDVVGGWWVEPDMNIPSGEAMVRQGLYGQLTFQKLLGRKAKVATNPDSFGHTSTLPQIIRSQGMDHYIFMRPGPHEKNIPADLFWWEGADGTRVLTYRIQQSYNDSGIVKNRLDKVFDQVKDHPLKSYLYYFGAGDHGGGATKENMKSIEELKTEKGAPKILYSTTERFFREVTGQKELRFPTVKDDLQHHAVGCYTAESEIKKGNRQSESALVTAEKIAAIGSLAWGGTYPKKELTEAWQRVLFLQFHDSLAGTSLFEHSQVAREGYGFALDTAHQATYKSLQKLEWQVPAEDPASQYLIVFNPHAWPIRSNVEYDFNWGAMHKSSRVEDEKGNRLLHQWTAGSTETGSRKKLVFNAQIPAMGYRQIRLMDGESDLPEYEVMADESSLENKFLKVRFSDNGEIGIYDKENKKEVFAGGDKGCRAILIDDLSDTWSHDIKIFDKEIGTFGKATFKLLENGPLRATVRAITTWGASTLSIDWTLYSDSRNLEAKVALDWHERLKMLKFSFPVDVESPSATYETPYGHIVRETNGNEDPGQRWIDLTGKSNGELYGLTVLNDAKYGYNVPGNDLRISVARSAVYAHHNPKVLDMNAEHLWMDQGIQTFRLMLVPHKNSWQQTRIPRIAEEFMAPVLAIYQGIHGGNLPKTGSFLSIDEPNLVVPSVKVAENGSDLILRCVETDGTPGTAEISLPLAIMKWTGKYRPFEIKTLRISQNDVKEVNLLEE